MHMILAAGDRLPHRVRHLHVDLVGGQTLLGVPVSADRSGAWRFGVRARAGSAGRSREP
jgi:hypothetical protein